MPAAFNALAETGNYRYSRLKDEDKRALAVAAALELIALNVTGAADGMLESELDNLSAYADKIQAALGGN